MTPEMVKETLERAREYFNRSTRLLEEKHAAFTPQPGMFSVSGQIAHAAQTIEWFFDAAFSDNWRMDFEALDKDVRGIASLAEARAWFERAVDNAIRVAEAHSEAEWASPFKPNPIMGEAPRISILGAVSDHTAHHRGALTVYQRMLGITPLMPYMEM